MFFFVLFRFYYSGAPLTLKDLVLYIHAVFVTSSRLFIVQFIESVNMTSEWFKFQISQLKQINCARNKHNIARKFNIAINEVIE